MSYGYVSKRSDTMIVEFKETVPEEKNPRSLLVHLGNLGGVLEHDPKIGMDKLDWILIYLGGAPIEFRMSKKEFYARLVEVMQR